jgi:hypothetical protein
LAGNLIILVIKKELLIKKLKSCPQNQLIY